jgi:hypothetical protein
VCAELPLRIVANGDKKVTVLDSFMPRLGALLENQCGTLALVRWKLTDAQNNTLAQGTASKAKDWAPVDTGGCGDQYAACDQYRQWLTTAGRTPGR